MWRQCLDPLPGYPFHAIHKHFIKNKLRIDHPISAYRDDQGNLVTLTCFKFVRRINEILGNTKKGYPHISGHCFRIGGTSFYLVLGVPPNMVKKFGCWQSQALVLAILGLFGCDSHRDVTPQTAGAPETIKKLSQGLTSVSG